MSRVTFIATFMLLAGLAVFIGCSLEELPEELTTPIPDVPVPTNLSAVLGDSEVTLSWTADASFEYAAFVIYRNELGASPSALATTSASPSKIKCRATSSSVEYAVKL